MGSTENNLETQATNQDRAFYKRIFDKAYQLMNEAVIDGNCGELCGFHCCRHSDPDGEKLGMYLLPLEFEYMQSAVVKDFSVHRSVFYDMPPKIKKMYYIFCDEDKGCLRDFRPIQCRTYPFEPHIENGQFSLVIEKHQMHRCPLLGVTSEWRQAYIDGIFKGWSELIKIPIIHYYIAHLSQERVEQENILKRYQSTGWV